MSTPMLFFLALGGYLVWYAVTHWGQTDVFGPLKNLVQGKGLQ
jgi:hypothetical protein